MRARIEAELAGRLSEGEPSAPNLYGFPTVEDCDGERRSLIAPTPGWRTTYTFCTGASSPW